MNTQTYVEVVKVTETHEGVYTIDFEMRGNLEDDHNLNDFDLSSIGDFGNSWGDENNFSCGWCVIDEFSLKQLPKVGDRFPLASNDE